MKSLSYLMGLSLLTTSCATIMNGSYQSIGIASEPTDAEIWLDSYLVGRTPTIVQMERDKDHLVKINLEGYLPHEIAFTRNFSGWVAGNLIFGGFIGLAVDVISGSIYKLTPEQAQIQLNKEETGYTQKSNDSFVTIVLEANPSWEKVGQLVACN